MSRTTTTGVASSNWLALQKKLPKSSKKSSPNDATHARKRRKTEHAPPNFVRKTTIKNEASAPIAGPSSKPLQNIDIDQLKNDESIPALRHMVLGEVEYPESLTQPGKYFAIDCEMVGVGIDGLESSLARVTLVNYYGAVQLDEFVKQRERVVDYRTQYSGVREEDMVRAKPFEEIQQRVAELIKDRILVGHAVHNDLKALLLSHPWPLTRDTQHFAGKHKVVRSKYVALRNLVKQELDITIQGGEHSSLTDARATMAVYRLHRKEWEKGSVNALTKALLTKTTKTKTQSWDEAEDQEDVKGKGKRKRTRAGEEEDDVEDDEDAGEDEDENENDEDEDEGVEQARAKKNTTPKLNAKAIAKHASTLKSKSRTSSFPGGGRKGVSSGLSTVVRNGTRVRKSGSNISASSHHSHGGGQKTQWWKELGNGNSSGSKGSKGSLSLRS